jgi:hypothetical protein
MVSGIERERTNSVATDASSRILRHRPESNPVETIERCGRDGAVSLWKKTQTSTTLITYRTGQIELNLASVREGVATLARIKLIRDELRTRKLRCFGSGEIPTVQRIWLADGKIRTSEGESAVHFTVSCDASL